MRRLAVIAAAWLLLPIASASAASSATATAGQLAITGSTGADSVALAQAGSDITIVDPGGVTANAGCTPVDAVTATCAAITAITATLNDGNDTFTAGSTITLPLTIDGGAGDDILLGGAAGDTITGGDGIDLINGDAGDDLLSGGAGDDVIGGGLGRDSITGDDGNDLVSGDEGDDSLDGNEGADFVSGGDGDDEVDGGSGNDGLSGGEGDDILDGGLGADSMEGDQGIDVVTYDRRSEPLTITVGNGLSDDGAAGENDQVGFSVENVIGGSGPDHIVGSSLANDLDGGPGDDVIDGGDGADTVTGGAGNDQIALRDAFADHATCGAGADTVLVDAADQAAADCESVQLPEPPAPPAPLAPPASAPAAPPLTTAPVLSPAAFARPRVTPRVAIRVGPRRDRHAPYSFTLLGRVTPPGSVNPRTACADIALLDVQVRRGSAVLLTQRPRLRSDCTFSSTVTFKGPKHVRPTRLRFTTSFLGNAYLVPARAKSVSVHVG